MPWIKKGSKTEYLEFIRSIDQKIKFEEETNTSICRTLFLRKDVDYDLDHALKFADNEMKLGTIYSTYFLLPTAPYFDYSFDFKMKVRALIQMGFGVGLHNNYYYSYLKENWDLQTLRDNINRDLNFLREIDEHVDHTSCHGQREHYDMKFFNYQIWEEFDIEKNEGFKGAKPLLSLEEFKLSEVYFCGYTHYYSDSGGQWIGYEVDGQKPFERSAANSSNNLGTNVIKKFNECRVASLQVLTHPCHWEEVK